MNHFYLIAILIFLFISCSYKEKKIDEGDKGEKTKKEVVVEKNKAIDTLVAKYNITYKWDTLFYLYTAKYKPVINSGHQLIEKAFVTDIYEKEDVAYVSIMTSLFNFDLQINKEQEDNFMKGLDAGIYNWSLIVSISDLKKIEFSIKGESNEGESAKVDVGISHRFIGHGKVIEIVSLQNKSE